MKKKRNENIINYGEKKMRINSNEAKQKVHVKNLNTTYPLF